MTEGFELVGTITMRTDDKGYLDIVSHIDKTSNSSAPSNRDFYFEVAYKDNPGRVVAISNTVAIRHIVPGNPKTTLVSDKDLVIDNDMSRLTITGTDFNKNVPVTIKVYRKVDDSLASIIETKNVVTDNNGEFTLDVYDNYGVAAAIPSERIFFTESYYTLDNRVIYTSNDVLVTHKESIEPS